MGVPANDMLACGGGGTSKVVAADAGGCVPDAGCDDSEHGRSGAGRGNSGGRRRGAVRKDVPEACRAMIHVNPAQNPIAENVPRGNAEKVYALYTKLYQANKGLFKELAKL